MNEKVPSDHDRQIQLLVGTASEASWPGVSRLPDFGKILFPDYPPRDFQDEFPDASEPALAVLADTLALDPARRRTAAEARNWRGILSVFGHFCGSLGVRFVGVWERAADATLVLCRSGSVWHRCSRGILRGSRRRLASHIGCRRRSGYPTEQRSS